jgi:hypothetical protein
LFALDGKPTDFSSEDQGRRNTVVKLLSDWGLIAVVDPSKIVDPQTPLNQIKILPFKEKNEWSLVTKYNIGRKK